MKADFAVLDADAHVIDRASYLLPYIDQPYRDRLSELLAWRRANPDSGHMAMNEVPYNILGQGYERTGRRLLGTRDVADNLSAGGKNDLGIDFHEQWHDGSGYDPQITREDLDGLGIDRSVFFPSSTSSIVAIDEAPYEAAVVRGYNRWVGEFCNGRPGEFYAVGLIPHWDMELAVAEVDLLATEDWCVGITTCMTLGAKLPDHPYFDPVYARMQDSDLALCIHSGTDRPPYAPARSELSDNYFLLHMTGHPWQQMRVMAAMVGGGIYERFPRLRTAHLESGCGWVPYWMQRMDDHFESLRHTVPYLRSRPSEHVAGGRCFISFEADEKILPAVAEVVGEGQLVYASDYPHYDANWDALDEIVDRKDLTDDQKRRFLGTNALRLFTRIPA